jgi:apolipoprotein N-acyltransferase
LQFLFGKTTEAMVQNVRFLMNLVLAFCFSSFLAISQGKHDNLLWWLSLALIIPGVWLMRSNPPWWHGGSFFASMVAGHLFGNSWLGVHALRSGSIMDDFAWIFLVLAI